jgi:hypothetical protein
LAAAQSAGCFRHRSVRIRCAGSSRPRRELGIPSGIELSSRCAWTPGPDDPINRILVSDIDPVTGVVRLGRGPRERLIRIGDTARAALVPFLDRAPAEPLLISRRGAPLTDRVVHEQLRRIGQLAGLGEWVSCRHTRRTYLRAVAQMYPADVLLRLLGHSGSARMQPASSADALAMQLAHELPSALDSLLAPATLVLAA